jgi:SAM-dependent methyltransferase
MNEFDITSEVPSVHWPDINVKNKRVLDLGCGRWDARELKDTTPYYFLEQGAEFLVGVDASDGETQYYRSLNFENAKFATLKIQNKEDLLQIINHFNINVIKSDIEGSETVFLSFNQEDVANIDSFYIEYHSRDIREQLEAKLPELGFVIQKIGKLWADGIGVIFADREVNI